MSPGTTSLEGISTFTPFLITLALGEESAFKLLRDCSAFTFCTVPKIAFIIITAKITRVLSTSPVAIEIRAATINIPTKRSLNCSKKTTNTLFFFFSVNSLNPFSSFDLFTCSVDKPSLVTLKWFKTSLDDFEKNLSIISSLLF